MSDVTKILDPMEGGDATAAHQLLPLVYEELRRLAAQKMAHEAPGQTLQPTALVHEAWLRLTGLHQQQWNSRNHFLAAASEAMRRILIDNARRKSRVRHGKGLARVDLDQVDVAIDTNEDVLLEINEVLDKLAADDPVKGELVKMRFFLGLSIPEAGRALGLSETTTKRYWAYARAWLYTALRPGE